MAVLKPENPNIENQVSPEAILPELREMTLEDVHRIVKEVAAEVGGIYKTQNGWLLYADSQTLADKLVAYDPSTYSRPHKLSPGDFKSLKAKGLIDKIIPYGEENETVGWHLWSESTEDSPIEQAKSRENVAESQQQAQAEQKAAELYQYTIDRKTRELPDQPAVESEPIQSQLDVDQLAATVFKSPSDLSDYEDMLQGARQQYKKAA